MLKKMMLLAMAVGALVALAAPAMASAVTLTDEHGNAVPVGTIVTATSANSETTAGGNVIACEEVDITGEVTENNGPHVTIEEMTVSTSDPCFFNGFPIVHIRAAITGKITLEPGGGGLASGVSFEAEITGVTTCTFTGSGAGESLPVGWAAGGVSLGGAVNLNGAGPGCPGAGEIHGSFGITSANHAEIFTLDP